MNNLRKKILKEIKILLKEAGVATELKSGLGDAGLETRLANAAIKADKSQLRTILRNAINDEAAALKAAGMDAKELEQIANQVESITSSKEAVEALAAARQSALKSTRTAAPEAKAAGTAGDAGAGETGAAAGTAGDAGAAAGTEFKAAAGDAGAVAGTAAQTEKKISADLAAMTPEEIKRLSDISEKDLRGMLETQFITQEMFDTAMRVKKQLSNTPGTGRWAKIKEFVSNNIVKCRQSPKWCGAILTGAGLSLAGLAYFGLGSKGTSPAPNTPPVPGAGDVPKPAPAPEADAGGTMRKSGRSFDCKDASSVAKFQRWINKKEGKRVLVADGVFGRTTWQYTKKHVQGANGNWEDVVKGNNPQTWCKFIASPNAEWAKEDGSIEKAKKKKKPSPKPATQVEIAKCGDGTNAPFNIPDNCWSQGIYETPSGVEVKEEDYKKNPEFYENKYGKKEQNLKESWHRKEQTKYTNNLFERLVKSLNNKKVI